MTCPRLSRRVTAALLAVVLPLWLGACHLLLDLSDPEPAVGDPDAAVADASAPDGPELTSDASPDAEVDAAIDAAPDAACVPTYSCAGNGRFNECTGAVEPCVEGLRCCVRGGGATCWPASGCPG
jgi:hypothetical protein